MSSSSSSNFCCEVPNCIGANCAYFSNWVFSGMSGDNSDACALYVLFDNDGTKQQVSVYKGPLIADLVALGQSVDATAQTITFSERNSSGLSGSVDWDATKVFYPGSLALVCENSSSSSSSSSFEHSSSSSSSSVEHSSSSSSSSAAESSSSSSTSHSSSSSSSDFCCVEPYCTGDDCDKFSLWDFQGMNSVNSNNCMLYAQFDTIGGQIQVRIYKDNVYLSLVALGQSTGATPESITLSERNSSGLMGSVQWDGPALSANLSEATLDCFESSSSSFDSSSSSSLGESSSSSSLGESSSSSSVGESSSSSSKDSSSSSSSSSSSEGESSSSSSSVGYSSSSSSSSELYSSSSSSSKDSSSSSSSSSFGYTSSSSSSLWDLLDDKMLPFTIEEYTTNPSWDIAFYGQYSFVGTGSNGYILRSTDRYHWGLYHQVDDLHVSAVHVDNGYLYAGTSPNGKLYRFKMAGDEVTYYDEYSSGVTDFCSYAGDLFVSFESGDIYKYDSTYDTWHFEYKAYAEITEMDVTGSSIYVAVKGSHVITYDGSKWDTLYIEGTNISSIRNVSKYFPVETYPQNRSIGLSCIEQDGTSIIMGSIDKARVYSYLNNELKVLFDTNSNNVHDIMNLDIGVNLVAIDNKLYLLQCGMEEEELEIIPSNVEIIDPIVEEEEEETNTIVLTYPSGGEQIELGQELIIQWSSTRNQNDAVKLELYQRDGMVSVITNKTLNDGSYSWAVPLSTPIGIGYKIRIEWLSAGEPADDEVDFSALPFEIVIVATTTTTTTTLTRDPLEPDHSICRGVPVLVLPEDEYITKMAKDNTLQAIVLTTSLGRILECKESVINGYLTGNRNIWTTVRDGMGFSNSASTEFTYALYNKIVEVNEEKEIVEWKYVEEASASPVDEMNGIFISPALYVQEDIGFWKQLTWTETKPSGTSIILSLRTANNVSELHEKNWEYSFKSEDGEIGTIIRDLGNAPLKGQYLQIKVEMEATTSISPVVANVMVTYATKFSSYFYSTRFSLENNSNVDKGLIIAQITKPINTEVKIGVCGFESNDWNDYQIVSLDKFFSIDDYDSLKVGMKFETYDDVHVPESSGFTMVFSGDKKQIVET